MTRRLFAALLALTVAANAVIFVLRGLATFRYSRLIPVPIEGPGLYAIWRIQHGFPLAEWPTRPFFGLTLYNFLFYETYERVLQLVGITGAGLPTGAHLLTPLAAAIGAVAQYDATRTVLRRLRCDGDRVVVAAAAFLFWFGAGIVGSWAFAARPDVAALAAATVGLALVVRSLDDRSAAPLVAASIIFFVAWSFKQSVVGIFAGVCAFELVARRAIGRTAALAVPFAVLCGAALAIGGPAYRFNLLTAPRVSEIIVPWLAVYFYRGLLLPNLPLWLAAAAGMRRWRRDASTTVLACCIATTVPLGILLLSKPGSDVNHTFESCVPIAIFAVVAFLTSARNYALAAAAMLAPLAFAVLLLAGAPEHVLGLLTLTKHPDPLTIAAPARYASRAALVERMRSLPKPIFIDDDVLAQPWFTTDNRYPAVVIDHVFDSAAEAGGYLERDGVLSLVDDRYFATLLLSPPPYYLWRRRAVAAGYVPAGTVGMDGEELTIYLRSDTAPRRPLQSRRPTRRRTP